MKHIKTLAIIPARGGSKGLPGKNYKPLLGKPLFIYSVEVAKSTNNISNVIVSTDCEKVIEISRKNNVDVCIRPSYLATDTSLVIDAVRYTVTKEEKKKGYRFDYIILLEPTSPMRTIEIVSDCTNILINDNNIKSIATYSETELPPTRAWSIRGGKAQPYIKDANPWLPRQQHENGYQLNGLYYGICRDRLINDNCPSLVTDEHFAYITPRDISIDIDTEIDFNIVEYLIDKDKG
ncbi:acylneuraminate cytidylyltransferase family protein [Vibrio sp. 2-2(8)]|uniref:acylneuraminate cytidylyltransferase family protein n=1 Tax=Vibrio sp. 2-2(8) TaxID=2591014 RepID=UPI00148340E9|nr:acylneuraminate cytidylyltransferase family protein [Vibrio sp. 2-2(8)]NNN48632.1 acylneuraminate cytidylyltransferase family protein [Vibrio sp. 2-2(8)]